VRQLRYLILFAGLATAAAFAQEAGKAPAENGAAAEGESGSLKAWEWANFLVLAIGLGYIIVKNARPAYAARSLSIRRDIVESQEIRKDAEARAADVDRRLANLEREIAALRAEAQKESEAEKVRFEQQTVAELQKVRDRAEQEIASAAKAARMELKRYSAELAVELAEQKIRARMTPRAEDALVRGFVRDLGSSSPHTT
jgi:F-type H+-transporting ATPase subunit b